MRLTSFDLGVHLLPSIKACRTISEEGVDTCIYLTPFSKFMFPNARRQQTMVFISRLLCRLGCTTRKFTHEESIDWCPSGGGIPVIESSNSQGRAARQVALCGELGGFPVSDSRRKEEGGASNLSPLQPGTYALFVLLSSNRPNNLPDSEFPEFVAGLQVWKPALPISVGLTHNLNLMANTRADTRCTTMISGRNGDARFPIVPLDWGTDKPWEKPKTDGSLSPALLLSRQSRRNGSPGSLVARRRCAWTLLR